MADMENRLRQLRKRRGLTQAELEERIGARKGTISRLESGEVEFKTYRLIQIGKALDVDPVAILGGEALTGPERAWLHCFRKMSVEEQGRWLRTLEEFTDRDPLAPRDRRESA